jgi:hypothetical protein
MTCADGQRDMTVQSRNHNTEFDTTHTLVLNPCMWAVLKLSVNKQIQNMIYY